MDGYAPTIAPPPGEARGPSEPGRSGGQVHLHRAPEPVWMGQWRAWRPFLLAVIAPTLVVAAYLYGFAADQYRSEAHFIVRTGGATPSPPSGLGQVLGLPGASAEQSAARSIDDYLVSHDAVAALERSIDLLAVFRPPQADWLSRLPGGVRPAPETVLKFYRRQVKVAISAESGITTLTVRAFRPQDASRIAERLLELGEARVNTFNQRALDDSLSVARRDLRDAEAGVAQAQGSVTGFRQSERDIDPQRTSSAQVTLLAGLQQQLAEQRAMLAGMPAAVGASSPQRVALAAQVRALEGQVGAVQARLAGPASAMAPGLGAFESLRLRQEFAAKRYEAAAAALESARTEALRQQLFVVRVVEPNLPVKPLYPERSKTLATVFFGLLLAYAIGWLILAGVREHAS